MENTSFAFSANIAFLPWVGPDFNDGINGMRTMVLGESIYCCVPYSCSNPNCKYQVIDMVTKQINFREKNKFYTKIAKLLYRGSQNSLLNKIDFWNKVAFYELVQVSVGTKTRQRPLHDMWENSKEPLFEVLKVVKPEIVYVTGKELTANFLNKFESKRVYKDESGFFECNLIKFEGKWIKTISFYHPAYFKGFNYRIQDMLFSLAKKPLEELL
jgi:hypothetical protein